MSRKRHVKEIGLLILFFIVSIGVVSTGVLIQNNQNTTNTEAATNWDDLCEDGVYYIQKDGKKISCGRAPNCDGYSYESMAGIDYRSNAECWVEDYFGGDRCKAYCAGNVPLCCYKMAESGNAEDCPFPERGYCMRDQCKAQTQDSNCGAQQGKWCIDEDHCVENRSDIPKLSLQDRLSGRSQPAQEPTEKPNPPTATRVPSPTTQQQNASTLVPTQPSNNNQNSLVTQTPSPSDRPSPTPQPEDSFAFNFSEKEDNTAFADKSQNGNQNEQNTNESTENNNQNQAQENSNNSQFNVSIPRLQAKSPQQVIRETITYENVAKVNTATDKPLTAAKDTFVIIKSYDQKLETTVERWIFRIRVQLQRLLP